MNWQILLHIIAVMAAVYAGICVVYYFIQERFLFVPIHTSEFKERRIRLPFEEMMIDTPHEGIIHAHLFKANQPKAIVFYLHGNTGSLKRWRFMAEDICKLGFDVFVMEYRGYGDSLGKRSEAIMHRDVEFCYDYIMQRYDLPKIIYGRSLGCAFATRLASRRQSDKLVLETPFNNMADTARSHVPFLPVKLLLKYRFRSDIYIKQIDCPIHIFHGTLDLIVPYHLAFQLYQIAKAHNPRVTITTIKRGRHSNLKKFSLFREKLNAFLNLKLD